MAQKEVARGLENVTVSTTRITEIGSEPDRILYRGYDLQTLSKESTYEETAFLLLHGELPSKNELESFSARIRTRRELPEQIVTLLRHMPVSANPIDVLCAMVSALGAAESGAFSQSEEMSCVERLVAVIPTIVAYQARISSGHKPVEPRTDLSHAANLLYMLRGQPPTVEDTRFMDAMFILHADNELNTSTFCARIVASARADPYSCFEAALCALKGPIHGGAGQQVMKMVESIGSPERVPEYVEKRMSSGERIVGFGHRVYRDEDPRATVLRRMSREIGESKGDTSSYEILSAIEHEVRERRRLPVNVDLYSGSVYSKLGIDIRLFTSMFAIGRTSGLGAHVLEEYGSQKLISPIARYEGSPPRGYIPIVGRP